MYIIYLIEQMLRIFDLEATTTTTTTTGTKYYELPFSQIVQDSINQVNLFIEGCIQYLSGLSEYYDQNVITYLDSLYSETSNVIRQFVQGRERDPLQLCQLALNINYLEKSIGYYRRQIEQVLQVSSTREFEAVGYFKNARFACEEAIQENLNKRILAQCRQLSVVDWCPEMPLKGPHDFFEMMVSQYESQLSTMGLLVPQFVQSSIYLSLKFINGLIWKVLIDEVKHFNILGLVNLNQDINCLINVCHSHSNSSTFILIINY